MTRTYRATVTIEFTDASPREFSRLLDVVTDSVLSYEPSEHALVLGNDEARLITLKYWVDAGSKSSAKGKVETLLRRISYRVDGQHNPSPEKDARFHQELVAC